MGRVLEGGPTPHKDGASLADTSKGSHRRWGEMIVTGGGRRLEILAAAGLRDCANCHHRTMHFVVDDGEQLLSVDPSGLGRTKLLVCDVCRHTSSPKEQEVARTRPGKP